METTAQPDLSRLPTKMDSNAAKYCGNGYVIVFLYMSRVLTYFFLLTPSRGSCYLYEGSGSKYWRSSLCCWEDRRIYRRPDCYRGCSTYLQASRSFPVFVVIIVFFAPGIQLDIQHCSRVCCSTGSQHYHLENFIFESFNFATFLQVYFMYPETVSRSLEEVEEIFSQGHTLTAWKIGKIVCKKTLKEVVEKSKNLPVTFFLFYIKKLIFLLYLPPHFSLYIWVA